MNAVDRRSPTLVASTSVRANRHTKGSEPMIQRTCTASVRAVVAGAFAALLLGTGFAAPVAAQDVETAVVPGTRPSCGGSGGVESAMSPGSSADADCDGLSDSEENYWRLDPYNRDSDGDGLADGDEFYDRHGKSDPSVWDSDYDGLGDGDEVYNYGTDPWNWDTDGDGRGDGEEVAVGANPRV